MHKEWARTYHVQKEETKCNNIKKQNKNWLTHHITKRSMNEYNSNWSQISDHPYRILLTGASISGKTNQNHNSPTRYW